MALKKFIPVAIYTRKSTNSEDKQAVSIQRQTLEAQLFCQVHGMTIVKSFSESKSGKDNNRPEFKKLIKWFESGNITTHKDGGMKTSKPH